MCHGKATNSVFICYRLSGHIQAIRKHGLEMSVNGPVYDNNIINWKRSRSKRKNGGSLCLCVLLCVKKRVRLNEKTFFLLQFNKSSKADNGSSGHCSCISNALLA